MAQRFPKTQYISIYSTARETYRLPIQQKLIGNGNEENIRKEQNLVNIIIQIYITYIDMLLCCVHMVNRKLCKRIKYTYLYIEEENQIYIVRNKRTTHALMLWLMWLEVYLNFSLTSEPPLVSPHKVFIQTLRYNSVWYPSYK